jgi:hypothetical protein
LEARGSREARRRDERGNDSAELASQDSDVSVPSLTLNEDFPADVLSLSVAVGPDEEEVVIASERREVVDDALHFLRSESKGRRVERSDQHRGGGSVSPEVHVAYFSDARDDSFVKEGDRIARVPFSSLVREVLFVDVAEDGRDGEVDRTGVGREFVREGVILDVDVAVDWALR